jgi:uncharacterized protein YpmB
MKEKIVILVAFVTIGTVSSFAYGNYLADKHNRDLAQTKAAETAQKERDLLQKNLTDTANKAVEQCKIAVATINKYNALATTKVTLTAPVCPASILE